MLHWLLKIFDGQIWIVLIDNIEKVLKAYVATKKHDCYKFDESLKTSIKH